MKILVVYYTVYGHVLTMAKAVEEGAKSVAGSDVILRRAREFPDTVQNLNKEGGYAKQIYDSQASIPECTLDDLRAADGVIFGSPTRYGNMTAQMKALIDSTAQLWLNGEMEGKPAGVFTSTASTHGGQERTLLPKMAPLVHLGDALWRQHDCRPAGRAPANRRRSRHREGAWQTGGRGDSKVEGQQVEVRWRSLAFARCRESAAGVFRWSACGRRR